MKILVFSQQLVIGGATINAIELAACLRDHCGHQVTIFGASGPLLALIQKNQLDFWPAPEGWRHPTVKRMRALRDIVRRVRPDIVHAWEWAQCLDAYYGVHLDIGVPLLVTDMLMHVNRVLPKEVPITYGTPDLVQQAKKSGWRRAKLLLPPVDVEKNAPGVVDTAVFRERYAIRNDHVLIATVSRLDPYMKGDSLIRTIKAVAVLGEVYPLQLVIVGGGPAQYAIANHAERANALLGRQAVILTGELEDPRPAYASANVIVGMGSSALRGMAFAKPVVVVGAGGFATLFTLDTAEHFLRHGFYGCGDGTNDNSPLEDAIRALVRRDHDPDELGKFSRNFVVENFGLARAAEKLSGHLTEAAQEDVRWAAKAKDVLRTSALYLRDRVFLWRSLAVGQNTDTQQSATLVETQQ